MRWVHNVILCIVNICFRLSSIQLAQESPQSYCFPLACSLHFTLLLSSALAIIARFLSPDLILSNVLPVFVTRYIV
jgi:hypothetical protein